MAAAVIQPHAELPQRQRGKTTPTNKIASLLW
jgi:hypothetical protein